MIILRRQLPGAMAGVLVLFSLVWGLGCEKQEPTPPPRETVSAETRAGDGSSPRTGADSSRTGVASGTIEGRASTASTEGETIGKNVSSSAADSGAFNADAVKRVLARAAKAMHVSEEVRNRVIVGHATCQGPKGEFVVDLSSTPDGRLWFRQVYQGRPSYVVMVTEQGVFGLNEAGERTQVSGRDMLLVKSHNFQRIAMEPRVFVERLALAEEEVYHGVSCVSLEGFTPGNSLVDFFYRKQDGRPAGYRITDSTSPGQSVEIEFQEWTEVDGVDLPSKITATDDQAVYNFHFDTLLFEDLMPPPEEETQHR